MIIEEIQGNIANLTAEEKVNILKKCTLKIQTWLNVFNA